MKNQWCLHLIYHVCMIFLLLAVKEPLHSHIRGTVPARLYEAMVIVAICYERSLLGYFALCPLAAPLLSWRENKRSRIFGPRIRPTCIMAIQWTGMAF